MDLTGLSTNGNEIGTPTTAPPYLGMSLLNDGVNTPPSMPSADSIVHSVERFVNRTPATNLANSAERKLFEDNGDVMRAVAAGITKEDRKDLEELEELAQLFRKQRIKFGFTQGDVGLALGRRFGAEFSQTTISRFEALNLSFKNMCKLRPILKEWLTDAEAAIANGATTVDLLDMPTADKSSQKADSTASDGDSTAAAEPAIKKRRKRTNLDVNQRTTLDAYFLTNNRPDLEKMTEIANLLELERDVVRVWFCNRRQKMKKADQPEHASETPLMVSLRAIAEEGDRSEQKMS